MGTFCIIGVYFILNGALILGNFIGYSGVIIGIILSEVTIQPSETGSYGIHKILSIFFFSLFFIFLAFIEVIILIRIPNNPAFLVNVFAGGVFGGIFSFLLFEINNMLKSERIYTIHDVGLSFSMFLLALSGFLFVSYI